MMPMKTTDSLRRLLLIEPDTSAGLPIFHEHWAFTISSAGISYMPWLISGEGGGGVGGEFVHFCALEISSVAES